MEPSDLPLVVPITATVFSMFSETIAELNSLRETMAAEELKSKPLAVTEAAAAPEPETTQQQGKKGKPAKKEKEASSKSDKTAAADGPNAATPTGGNADPSLAAGPPPPKDAWKELADDIRSKEEALLKSYERPHQWMKARLAHLNTTPATGKFMIEDVLGEWTEPLPELPEGVIDASAMAAEHTRRLTETYGYKPPRGLHEVGKVEPWDQSVAVLQPKFSAHQSSGAGMELPFVSAAALLPPSPPPGGEAADGTTRSPGRRFTEKADRSVERHSDRESLDGAAEFPSLKLASGGGSAAGKVADQKMAKVRQLNSVAAELSQEKVEFSKCLPGLRYTCLMRCWNRDINSRQFKLASSPSPLVSTEYKNPSHDCNVPIVTGQCLEFYIHYTPIRAENFSCSVRLAHCRMMNAIESDKSLASQWTFVEIPVEATTVTPKLEFDGPLDFDPCFVFGSSEIHRTATNLGCPADFFIKASPPFVAEPSSFFLRDGESIDVKLSFHPNGVREFETEFVVETTLAHGATVHEGQTLPREFPAISGLEVDAEQFVDQYPASAEAIVPDIFIESLGGANFSGPPGNVEDSPFALLEDTCEGQPAQKQLAVHNRSPIPISFDWVVAVSGSCAAQVIPPTGVLPPQRTTVFIVELTPHKAEAVECLCKLQVPGLPAIPVGLECDALRRDKPEPTLNNGHRNAKDPWHRDPFYLFNQSQPANTAADLDLLPASATKQLPPLSATDPAGPVFFCAARLAADPAERNAHLVPTSIESDIACIIKQPNYRSFLIVNDCNCDLEFWLDPPTGDYHPAAQVDLQVDKRRAKQLKKLQELLGPNATPPTGATREGADLSFEPRRGIIPGNSAVTVQLSYVLTKVGPADIDVECYIPLLGRDRSPHLSLKAIGKGPTTQPSTTFLDYGIIQFGGEGEARFTLSNTCPIPLVYRMTDPGLPKDGGHVAKHLAEHHPGDAAHELDDRDARFIFMPDSGPLKPKESVEITVYLQGRKVGPFHENIEIVTDEGESKFIEVRATIQEPKAYVMPSRVDVGRVDRDIPMQHQVLLSNGSNVDIAYNMVALSVPPTMTLVLPQPQGVLHAGLRDVPIPIQVTFHGQAPSVAVVMFASDTLREPPVFEVTCSDVSQLSVALAVNDESGTKKTQTPYAFLKSLLKNTVDGLLDKLSENSNSPSRASSNGNSRAVEAFCPPLLFPYCQLDDNSPYCQVSAQIQLSNTSGCNTKLIVSADTYAPMFPAESTLTSTYPLGGTATLTNGPSFRSTLPGAEKTGTMGTMSEGGTLNAAAAGASRLTGGAPKRKAPLALTAATAKSPFVCKQRDGRGDREEDERRGLDYCGKLLIDGKGLAVEVKHAQASLSGYQSATALVNVVSNLPGHYRDTISIAVEGLPRTIIPVEAIIRGKPILLDPTTSGLTVVENGRQRIQLPTLVGGMSSVKRRIQITSRCPRDLQVSLSLLEETGFITSSLQPPPEEGLPFVFNAKISQSASAVPTPAMGDKKTSFLGLSGSKQSANASTQLARPTTASAGTVTPSSFFLAALESQEIVIEYTPPPGAGSTWKTQLTISSVLAVSPFNDAFYIDEYFASRQKEYPSVRTIASESLVQKRTIGEVKSIPKLPLRMPLIDRKNIVKDSVVCPEYVSDFAMAAHVHHDDDSDDEATKTAEDKLVEARAKAARQVQAGQERERAQLREYIRERRERSADLTDQYLEPTIVEVVAHTVHAKLTTDPPDVIRLPICVANAENCRTLHIKNEDLTSFDFTIDVVSGPFRVQRTQYIPYRGLKSQSNAALAQTIAHASRNLSDSTTKKPASPAESLKQSQDATSSPAMSSFHLRPLDELDVVVQLSEFPEHCLNHQQLEGSLEILYANGTKQSYSILASLHVPSLFTKPPALDFRPPVALPGGKPQPKYSKLLKLTNPSSCEARFIIRHRPANLPMSRADHGPSKQEKILSTIRPALDVSTGPGASGTALGAGAGTVTLGATPQPKSLKVTASSPLAPAKIIDDPSRFRISPVTGTVKPAHASGAPSTVDLEVWFDECGVGEYECTFEIVVDGGVGNEFTLRGVSSETEI